MKQRHITKKRHGQVTAGLMAAALFTLPSALGCLQEPSIDERWTLLEVLSSAPAPSDNLALSDTVHVSLSGRITYRAIRTGFLVAEARYSDTLGPANMYLDPQDHSLKTARKVEQILVNSVTAGRSTRAVTGFDHLMQTVTFDFSAVVPAEMSGGDPAQAGNRGMYLLLYLAEGDEIELEDRRDSLVVTPLPVDENELLFTGFALDLSTPNGGGTP